MSAGVKKAITPEDTVMTSPLEKELQTFDTMLPRLMADEGKFAVIHGDKLIGVFDTYPDALASGYQAAKLEAFLVKKIAGIETIAYFSRDVDNVCHTTLSG
jgi:hypothetical protein